ncbi:hypothetical protein ASE57_12080 [Sphingomonas sp. Leaf11]|nr:hypothetical protein ASE58_12075 [Sphingomonas sp. Leaf9]KQM42862.1 hypothetical protein ASE57_12080 [Sphingomonas sp. Leaf11]
MNSPSVVSRRAAFEILATLAVGIVGWLLSRLLRTEFTAPPGKTWLWLCAAVALIVAYSIAVRRGQSPLFWILQFTITYLIMQIVLQIIFYSGIF